MSFSTPAASPRCRAGMLSSQARTASYMSEAASSPYASPVRQEEMRQSVRQQYLARMSPTPAPIMMRGALHRSAGSMRTSDAVCAGRVILKPSSMRGVTPEVKPSIEGAVAYTPLLRWVRNPAYLHRSLSVPAPTASR